MRLAIVLVVLICPSPGLAAGQPATTDDRTALLQLERRLAATLDSRSQAEMERLLADDYVLRGAPDVPRATWIREALARCWGERFDIDDFEARLDGETAVTSFLLTFYVNPDSCMPGVMRSLITDVWVRDADGWRLRVRHSSPPPAGGVAAQFGLVPEVPPRWVLQGELSLVATGGNTSTQTLGVASDFTQATADTSSRVQFTYVSSEADSVTQARATTLQARQGWKLRDGFEVFGRAAYARDRFAGIDNRAALDAGLAYNTGRPPRHKLTTEASAGFIAEDRTATETLRFASATGAVRYSWQIAPASHLQEELAVTSDLTEGRNWRAANSLSLIVALTRVLSIKVTNGVEYRNLPVPGFRRADTRTSAALVFALRAR